MKLFLIGYRCTGKTTVGKLIAQRLRIHFCDLDELIAEKQGMSIQEIVARFGWPYFRTVERKTLLEISEISENLVVSCGGGAVLHRDAWEKVRKNAIIIWLTASVEVILRRMGADEKTAQSRPALSNCGTLEDEVRLTLTERMPIYQETAHLAVSTENRSVLEIADEVVNYARCHPNCQAAEFLGKN